MTIADALLTADVARLLNCTPANVRLMERCGRLRAERLHNGIRLFNRDEVERLAQQRRARASTAVEQLDGDAA